ncbi:MAG: SDR family oxidoreductase [Acidovorax sp.]|jgi:short-subunit dehydrogenase|nr:SDR family oxidoreductase [Acidovorax sp.]
MPRIILTGASDGIGAEIARQLAQQHGQALRLTLAARNLEHLQAVAAQCQAHGAQTLVLPTDVSEENACRSLVASSVQHFGGLDVLINNAGVSAHALLEEVSAEHLAWYERLMRTNFWGSVWCTHEALPHLKASRGAIVAVSSLAGLVGVPDRTAYSASKFAMSGFFEALRTELKPAGVAVTIAYPGVVDTRIRYHGYNASGQAAGVSGLKEDQAMPVAECARLIVHGMERRQREVVMTRQGKLGRWVKLIAPGVVERMALAALQRPNTRA